MLDEFNRATPRMQSGLLEAMEEHAVTVGKRRHALPRPFFCIGTMNPHDNTGTFEMAHASCDRFAMRTGIGYPSESGERDLLTRFSNADDAHGERPDRRARRCRAAAEGDRAAAAPASPCAPTSCACCAPRATIRTSSSAPRRARCSRCTAARQAAALLDNAAEVAVKHVRSLFEPCIAHRIRVRPEASARAVCEEILEGTPVPVTTPPPTISAAAGRPQPGDSVQIAA